MSMMLIVLDHIYAVVSAINSFNGIGSHCLLVHGAINILSIEAGRESRASIDLHSVHDPLSSREICRSYGML